MSSWKNYQKTHANKAPVERKDFIPFFPLSEAQEILIEALELTDCNVHAEAVAGSGKSSSIAILAARNKIDSLYLAFNKDIVADMESKLGYHVEVKTCHAYAFSLFRHAKIRGSVDSNKFFNLIKDNLMDWHPHRTGKEKNKWGKYKSLAKLFDMARLVRANMADEQEILNLITRYDIEFKDEEEQKKAARLIPKLEKISMDLVWNRGIIDFCEMIKVPLDYAKHIPQKEILYIDECQDLSPLIREFTTKLSKRVVSVGDRNQSIMGFAGADFSSVDKVKEQFDSLELSLDVCYRCPKKVVELAQQLVPHIKYFDKNPEGVINSFKSDDFDFNALPDSMVLSRRNSKLIRPCLEAIKKGRKAIIKGQDIGNDLASLAENMSDKSIEEFVNDVHDWREKQKKAVIGRRDEEQAKELIEDKAECLLSFSEGVVNPKTIPAKIKSVFSDSAGSGLVFSSMHKSKGLEADMVTIVDAGRMRVDRDGMSDEARQQEANLEYVAKTRPKQILNFVY